MPRIAVSGLYGGSRYGQRKDWYQIPWAGSRAEPNKQNWRQRKVPRRQQCSHLCQTSMTVAIFEGHTGASQSLNTSHATYETCCRCYAAGRWFGLVEEYEEIYVRDNAGRESVDTYAMPGGDPTWNLQSIERKTRITRGLRDDFREEWSRHGPIPTIDPFHIGWHVGLRRAPLRERSTWTAHLGTPRRGLDRAGVTAGPTTGQVTLCGVCRTILPSLPRSLFWEARGWSPAKARAVTLQEERRWKPGNGRQRIDLEILDGGFAPAILPW
jgi:hypothetical protein